MIIPASPPYPSTAVPGPQSSPSALLKPLKARLQQRLAACYAQVIPSTSVAHAVEQAALLACSTDFPHLFFPVLAEEAVRAVALTVSPDILPFKCAKPWQTPRSQQSLQKACNAPF